FFNPNSGNIRYGVASSSTPIDSSVPYAVVRGTGDGQHDTYTVTITDEMLSRPATNVTGTAENPAHNYYESPTLTLSGAVQAGDTWTLTISGKPYAYVVQDSDIDLSSVASGLESVVTLIKPAEAPYTVTAEPNGKLKIDDQTKAGLWFDLTHDVARAAAVVKTGVVATNPAGSTVTFEAAVVGLQRVGLPVDGETWNVAVGGVTESYTWGEDPIAEAAASDEIAYIAEQLAADLDGTGGRVVTFTGTLINILKGAGVAFNVSFEKSGPNSAGAATISGTPASAADALWSAVTVELTGTPSSYEDWNVTLNGNPFTYHVPLGGVSTGAVVDVLVTMINGTNGEPASPVSSDLLASNVSGTLHIAQKNLSNRAEAFTVSTSVTSGTNGSVTVLNADSVESHAIDATGIVARSGEWRIAVVTEAGAVYRSNSIDASAFSVDGLFADELVEQLNDVLPVNFGAAREGNIVVVTNTADTPTTNFSVSLSEPTTVTTVGKTIGTPTAGQVWAVSIVDGSTVLQTATHVATTGEDEIAVASALASGLQGLSGFAVASEGANVVVSHATNSGFDLVVSTSGTYTTPVNHQVELNAGTATSGQVWSVTLTEGSTVTPATFMATGGESARDIAINLAAQLDTALSGSGYTVAAVGNSVAASHATATFSLVDSTQDTAATFSDVITLTTANPVVAGQWWQLNVIAAGKVVGTASHAAEAGETPAGIASILAGKLNTAIGSSGYVAVDSGSDVAVTGNAIFTVEQATVRAASQFTTTQPTGTGAGNSLPPFTGSIRINSVTPNVGDVFVISLVDGGKTKYASYTWDGNEVFDANKEDEYIANQLQTELGTVFTFNAHNYATSVAAGRNINIVNPTTTFAVGPTLDTISGSYGIPNDHAVAFTGSINVGSTWAVSLIETAPATNTINAKYTWTGSEAVTPGQELNFVASQLSTQLATSGYSGTVVGDALVVSKPAATFTLVDASVDVSNPVGRGLTVSGTASDGQVWSAGLGAVTATHVSTDGESAEAIASDLASQLDSLLSGSGYSIEAVGNTVFADKPATTFTIASKDVQAGVSSASVSSDGIVAAALSTDWRVLATSGSGLLKANIPHTGGGTLDALVAALNSDLPDSYVASHDGSNLYVSRIGSGAVDVYLAEDTALTSAAAALYTLDGLGIKDEIWTVSNVDNQLTNLASYTVVATSESLASIAGLVAAQIDADLEANWAAYAVGNDLVIVHLGGGAPPVIELNTAYQAPAVAGNEALKNSDALIDWTHSVTLNPAVNPLAANDEWTLSIEGSIVDGATGGTAMDPYISQTSGIGEVTNYYSEKLAALGLNLDTAAGTPLTLPGAGTNTFTLHKSDGGELVIGGATQRRNTPSSDDLGPDGLPHYATAFITFAAATPTNSEVWSVTLNGVKYASAPVTTGINGKLPSQSKVLNELATFISNGGSNHNIYYTANVTHQVNNTGVVPVTDYVLTITPVNVTDPWFTGVSAVAATGGGKVHAIFDIDNATVESNVSFTATPYLELSAPDADHAFTVAGGTQSLTTYRQDKTTATSYDLGSLSYLDPFIEVDFTKAGTYTITVGSFIDYGDNTFILDQTDAGVYVGTSYDLNVSVQRHGSNRDAIVLVGKQLTVVDGAGVGSVIDSTILGYDAQTNTYTLDQQLNPALDDNSVLEFSYRMQDEFPASSSAPRGYHPEESAYATYDVRLSADPQGVVYVDVVPAPTRTYNANLAFDADANYGQNEAVQVDVSTPRAVIELTGTARANDTWVITIDGVTAADHNSTADQPLSEIALQLKTDLDAWLLTAGAKYQDLVVTQVDSDLTVDPNGVALVIDGYTNSNPAVGFHAGFHIDPDSRGSASTVTTQVIEFSGDAVVGETWAIGVNGGTLLAFDHQVDANENLADVARALQVQIGASNEYETTVRNRRITITRVDGSDFTLTPTAGSSGKVIVDTFTQVKLGGEVTIGETWTLTLDSSNTFGHLVTFGDDLVSVAESLWEKIANQGDYKTTLVGRVISVERLIGDNPISATVAIDGTSPGDASIKPQLKFTTNNWMTAQSVGVTAIDDSVKDGGDAKVVVSLDRQRVNLIRGPVTVDGGIHVTAEAFLTNPLLLPGENNFLLADGTLTGSGSASGVATITDANATYVDPVRGVMSGFDPRINDFTYSFTLFGDEPGETAAEKLSDSLGGTSITVKIENETATFQTMSITGNLTGTGDDNSTYISATIAVEGFVSVGQVWKLNLDNIDYPYTANTADGLTLFAVAKGLADRLPVQYLATPKGKLIEIPNGTGFTVAWSSDSEGTGRITGTENSSGTNWKLVEIPFSALTVSGVNPVSYSVTLKDTTATQMYTYERSGNDTGLDVIQGLAKLIDEDRSSAMASSVNPVRYHAAVKYDTVLLDSPWSFPDGALVDQGYFFAPLNPNVAVNEDVQVDLLNVFDGNNPTDVTGHLTSDRLYGLGMGGDTFIGGKLIEGGITYHNLESLNIELGSAKDIFTVHSTHTGTTSISGADGEDEFYVKSLSGHTLIDAGDGLDTVEVSGDAQVVDEIAALLTVFGGDDAFADELTVDDSASTQSKVGWLTDTSITGLQMPTIAEQQILTVRAASGQFTLGFNGEFSLNDNSTEIDGRTIPLNYNVDAVTLQDALNSLFGLNVPQGESSGIRVEKSVDAYLIKFGGPLAGQNIEELFWDKSPGATNTLVAAQDTSVQVAVEEAVRGSRTPEFTNNVQTVTLTVDATGSYRLRIVDDQNDADLDEWTDAITVGASAEQVLKSLQSILDPDNFDTSKSHTTNVAVGKHGDRYVITFQGAHKTATIQEINSTGLNDGAVELDTRLHGINYYGIENLTINLGFGDDVFNVRATAVGAVTDLNTADGKDKIYVTSDADGDLTDQAAAHGDLDGVVGTLHIQAGAGDNSLFVSDYDNLQPVDAGLITDSSIQLDRGLITYDAQNGNFDNGLVIWAGKETDTITVESVYTENNTITKLYANEGNDFITVTAADVPASPAHLGLGTELRRIDIFGNDGNDTVDAAYATLAVRVFGENGRDALVGGSGDDLLYGGADEDVIIGGAGTDMLFGEASADVIIGDHGLAEFYSSGLLKTVKTNGFTVIGAANVSAHIITAGVLTSISTDGVGAGDSDQIDAGDGNDIVFGGAGVDYINAVLNLAPPQLANDDEGADVIVGDGGMATFDVVAGASIRRHVETTSTVDDGGDVIFAANGSDVVLGGGGKDWIDGGADNGNDVILGDNGFADFDGNGVLTAITSNGVGDNDQIFAGEGNDVVFGGLGVDYINAV
ncbi:MAG: hypothetical protein ACI9HK_001671, partial [Pirellulaceae bacterium]